MMSTALPDITAHEMTELAEMVRAVHGFDFSDYSKASLKRRIVRIMMIKKLSFSDLKYKLADDPAFFQDFLEEITVNVTEMFRDPTFYRALVHEVVPHLAVLEQVKIWSAGCSSGEEAYSFAILTDQCGLKDKTAVRGSDVNATVLKEARKGTYNLRNMKTYAENYQLCGLSGSLNNYFTTGYDTMTIQNEWKQNVLFTVHNLVSDPAFDEFNLISCRNVFIYFETSLQEHILDIFYASLKPNGYLCLGSKETIRSERFRRKFKSVNSKENIYQKIAF